MVPLFLSAFLTISCGRSDETTHHRFAVTREDGIDVAVTTGGPKYTGDLFLYEMVQELRFDEKVEESLLIRPWSFTMDEEGNFYVADAGNHRIAVFSADGTYLRSIGRQGEGPGDLFGPINVEIIGDQVRVPGGTGERTSYFNRNGRFVESLTFPRAGTYLRGKRSSSRMEWSPFSTSIGSMEVCNPGSESTSLKRRFHKKRRTRSLPFLTVA
jgi:hypothetical protein